MSRSLVLLPIVAVPLLAPPAAAQEQVTPARIVADPKSLVGREIEVRGATCADVPSGFRCVVLSGRQLIRIDAVALGAATTAEIGEKLIETCNGEDKLLSRSCRFTITIRPRKAVSEAVGTSFGEPWTFLYSPAIEMR